MAPRALTIVLVLMGGCASVRGDDPKPAVERPPEPGGINWLGLAAQSLSFLGIEHGFRWVTEEGTRHPHRSFFDGYVDSLNSLHGWSDGDPFYVGYVGHPMQGAVAGSSIAPSSSGKTARTGRAGCEPLPFRGPTASSLKSDH